MFYIIFYHDIITGLQHYVISAPEPWGLPLNHTTMGQHFKRLGYATHIIGKVRLNAAQLLSFYMALRVCRGVINFNLAVHTRASQKLPANLSSVEIDPFFLYVVTYQHDTFGPTVFRCRHLRTDEIVAFCVNHSCLLSLLEVVNGLQLLFIKPLRHHLRKP